MKKLTVIISILFVAGISCSPKLAPDSYWGNQRWVLTEMKGVPVQLSGTYRDAYIEFQPKEKRFSGNAGCNRFSGNYELDKKSRIKLGEVITTKMSCPDIAFETAFLEVLKDINRYDSQNTVILFKDDKEVKLKFEQRTSSR